jgi:hypothetical protein
MAALAAPQAAAQTGGFWKFDEGNFLLGCPGSPPHDPQGHVLDWSGLGNHGCIENPRRNVKYTTDAYPLPGAGHFALHLNDPLDAATKDLVGNVFIPHDTSLEPPTGMITAQVKITAYPGTGTIVFAKSTFQFVRRESVMPIFDIGGQPRIVGRTVYQLEILSNGRLRATVANDDPLAPGPWTVAESGAALGLVGDWNHIEMKWDGCRPSVGLNGFSLPGVPYDPVPVLGLSYQGTGVDPTFGPLSLPAAISTDESPLVGKIDDVRLSRVLPCTQFSIASTQQLISTVQALNLPAGRERSLVSMLERVVAKLGPDPTPIGPDPTPLRPAAVNQLGAFINAVEAQRGKTIAQADADALIAVAESIVAGLTMR